MYPLELFILTGQSNAQGCILDGEPLAVSPEDADRNILFFWTTRGSTNLLSTSQGRIGRLQAQMFDNGDDDGNWGIEIACFRKLYRSGMRDLLVIKATRGGGGNALWHKGAPDHHMYDAVVTTVQGALDELRQTQRPFRFNGLLYLQGESDGESAPLAGERARQLLDNLKAEFPNARTLHMYIGGIAGFGPARDLVREQHRAMAAAHPDMHFIDTQDLLLTGQYQDNLHFNNAAKKTIGERFAAAILRQAQV